MGKNSRSYLKKSTGSKIFDSSNVVIMILLTIVILYPVINVIAYSFNTGVNADRNIIYMWPKEFTYDNYKHILKNQVYHAAYISALRTVIGTLLGVFFTAMLAYTVSRSEYMFRRFITLIYVFTMYFGAGLIPTYFLIRALGLTNSFWVYIWPMLISPFNLIVIRTYMKTIPDSLVESARIDSAGEFRIFLQIMIPLCKPVLATIALFVAVMHWNSWYDTFLYNPAKLELSTLQYELKKLITSANTNASGGDVIATDEARPTPKVIRATITVVAAAPILFIYPLLQKYFVAGLNVGSVKG